jgi:hypothetical protein
MSVIVDSPVADSSFSCGSHCDSCTVCFCYRSAGETLAAIAADAGLDLRETTMTTFRILLVSMLIVLVGYTAVVVANHGLNLFPYFFGEMAAITWSGQFNLDFMGFLVLSAVWTAWRNQFSAQGLGLSVLAFFGGILFLTLYLLYLINQCKGDMVQVLVGDARH